MKNIICVLCFIIVVVSSYAQKRAYNLDIPFQVRTKIIENNSIPDGVKGSPFYNDVFLLGTISTNDIKPYQAHLRYDAYNDEIQIKKDNQITALLKLDNINVEIQNEKYELLDYLKDGNITKGYFINLTEKGTTQLLIHRGKKFVEGVKASSSYGNDKPSTFKDDIGYYLYKNEKLTKIELKKKDILQTLSNKKEELKNYISENKLKLKKEKDFIQLINFYNSL